MTLSKVIMTRPPCRESWCKGLPKTSSNYLLTSMKQAFRDPDTLAIIETALAMLPLDLNYLLDILRGQCLVSTDDLLIREKMTELALDSIRRARCACSIMTICMALWPLLMYPQPLEGGIDRIKRERKKHAVFNENGTYK